MRLDHTGGAGSLVYDLLHRSRYEVNVGDRMYISLQILVRGEAKFLCLFLQLSARRLHYIFG
jgi:hypothetical protein